MKKFLLFSLLLCSALTYAQDSSRYELINDMPVYLEKIKARLNYPLAWGNSEITDYAEWRSTAREKVFDCMLTPPPVASNFDMKKISSQKGDGYTTWKIEFNISDFSRIPAYLCVPEGEGPFPAVVLLHDHGAHFSIGKEKMIRPFDVDSAVMTDADKWAKQCYDDQYFGNYLAENGYVVLAIDALFWGERGRKEGIRYDSQQAVASNFLQVGMDWSGTITYEDIYSVEFLASLPFVDAERIGCNGFSMGAYRAWMLSAMSDKVKAGAAICWLTTTAVQMQLSNKRNKGGSDFSMQLPGIRNYLDYPHIASIACPKPMLFFNGAKDKLFPVAAVEDAFKTMRQVWSSQGADDKLITKVWDAPHFFNKAMQKEVLEFFNNNLRQE
ncbi:MAG: dienelactone hydrolase family protein [Culturomica sp.]|jgi:dienelactone hydrolase|nr:dienelactone hydrolase family protein [Culturomica sp.]